MVNFNSNSFPSPNPAQTKGLKSGLIMSRGLEDESGESWVGFVSAQDNLIREQAVCEGNAALASVNLYQKDAKTSNELVSEV